VDYQNKVLAILSNCWMPNNCPMTYYNLLFSSYFFIFTLEVLHYGKQ